MKGVVDTDDKALNILATNESVNAITEDGQTPLHCIINGTVRSDYMYHVRRHFLHELVVGKGANIHALDKEGRSCLDMVFKAWEIGKPFNTHHPIEQPGFAELVASIVELITETAVLHQPIPWKGNTCSLLNWAICLRYDGLIALLLSKGFDVDLKMRTPGGNIIRSAVETACFYGCNIDCLNTLLERSTRLFEPDEEGHFLSHLLCVGPNRTTFPLEKLCEYGLNWDQGAVFSSKTPIMQAALVGKQDHVNFLLRHDVDLRAKDSHNWQVCHWAALSPNPQLLKDFLGREVDWSAKVHMRSKGEHLTFCSVLHIATASANPENVRLLVHESLIKEIDVLNGHGMSPLHIAAGHGSAEIVEILIQAGANINLKSPWSDNGMRPIHMAISHGLRTTTQVLLRHGCSLAPDTQGVTLELYALKYKQNDIISILKDYISKSKKGMSPKFSSHQTKRRSLWGLADKGMKLSSLVFYHLETKLYLV
jgi:ankyrin repeat protein